MCCLSLRDSTPCEARWRVAGRSAAARQFQTGLPCSVGVANDYAGVGESGSFNCQPPNIPTGSVGQFWVQHGGVRHIGKFAGSTGSASSPKWFATTAQDGTPLWTAPPAGTFNLQKGIRDNIFAPGLVNWNIAMIKAFPIFRENGFEFRAEAYNFPESSQLVFAELHSHFSPVRGSDPEDHHQSANSASRLALSLLAAWRI